MSPTAGWFVQGTAAAVMMPSSMALIGQAYTDPVKRARAVAVWAMGGAVVAALILLVRTRRSPHRCVSFDWIGQATAVLAMGGPTYGAIEAGAVGFAAPPVMSAFAVAVVAFAAFLTAQARGAHPMMPLELFRSRTLVISVVIGFAFIVGYYGLPFVMSLYLQQLRGTSSLSTGAAFLPMMLVFAPRARATTLELLPR
jgi:MFS family permease